MTQWFPQVDNAVEAAGGLSNVVFDPTAVATQSGLELYSGNEGQAADTFSDAVNTTNQAQQNAPENLDQFVDSTSNAITNPQINVPGQYKLALYGVALLVVLYLARPVFETTAGLTGDG